PPPPPPVLHPTEPAVLHLTEPPDPSTDPAELQRTEPTAEPSSDAAELQRTEPMAELQRTEPAKPAGWLVWFERARLAHIRRHRQPVATGTRGENASALP
ncbi:MAG: hypothetical protein KBT04_00690, partial [Bacteroidales bacterium]|nr:hypothetical protein [Candidatus Colimorpha onthohippi]